MVDGREKVGNIAWERDGSVDMVDGWENVGNSFGRGPLGGSEMKGMVDGWENVGNSLGRGPVGGSEREAWTSWTDGKPRAIAWVCNVGRWDMHSFVGRERPKKCTAVCTGFSGQIISSIYDCSEKLCAKTCQSFQTLCHGTCIASLAGSETKRA